MRLRRITATAALVVALFALVRLAAAQDDTPEAQPANPWAAVEAFLRGYQTRAMDVIRARMTADCCSEMLAGNGSLHLEATTIESFRVTAVRCPDPDSAVAEVDWNVTYSPEAYANSWIAAMRARLESRGTDPDEADKQLLPYKPQALAEGRKHKGEVEGPNARIHMILQDRRWRVRELDMQPAPPPGAASPWEAATAWMEAAIARDRDALRRLMQRGNQREWDEKNLYLTMTTLEVRSAVIVQSIECVPENANVNGRVVLRRYTWMVTLEFDATLSRERFESEWCAWKSDQLKRADATPTEIQAALKEFREYLAANPDFAKQIASRRKMCVVENDGRYFVDSFR